VTYIDAEAVQRPSASLTTREDANASESAGCDEEIVADDIEPGELDLFREVRLLVGHLDLMALDLQVFCGLRFRHALQRQLIIAA
jgi:hypothetical protein